MFYCLTVIGRYCRIVYYIILFIFDFFICLFFSLKISFLINTDIFDNEYYLFSYKNLHRYQLLCFHSTYTALAIFHNLSAINAWIKDDEKTELYFH